MNNSVLDILAAISIVSLAVAIYALWQILALNKLKQTFFAGQQAASLEDVIIQLRNQLKELTDKQTSLERELAALKEFAGMTISKVGLVRYNPFQGSGGNFSFSLALLNGHNSGIVLTSMYGREQNRIYTKKIELGRSETQLTDEELEAIKLADKNFLPIN